jgi:ABC-type branched-subunit amino acid transport system substrate-binding protein
MATPQDVAVATNGVRCAPLETAPGVHPALTIVSDFPLTGQNGPDGVPLADATLAVLRAHRFRAGRFTVGYRSCDYGLVNGAWSDAICSAHARAFAANPSVVGVIGTWHSGCAADEIPILARAQPPVPMISPANNGDGLTHNGRPNYLRVATTDAEQYAAVVTFAAGLGKHRFYAVGDDAFWLLGGVDVPAARLGVRVIDAADWAHDDGDATRLAHRVASSHADAVLLDGSHGEDEGRTIRALRRVLGPTVPMIAMRAIPITDITASAGPAAEGMYVVSEAPPAASLTRRGRAWLLQFAASERTNTAGSLSPLAAQATEAMLDAIAGSDGTRTGVLRAHRTAHVTGGILPDFSFTPGGDITPARFTVLRLRAGTPAGGDVQPDFGGAAVVGSFTVPLFDAGLAPTRGTPIGITLGREPAADAEATCGNPGQADCHFAGAFTAGDTTTARLLCPTGRTIEDERDQPQGYWVFGHRTLSCPDGSSPTMSVRLVVGGGITGDQVTNFGWEWVITGGTGRLARVRGDGISFEPRDAGHNILRGHMTGVVHL